MARVIIGTENSPFSHHIVITLTGQREDAPLVLANSVNVGSKAIGVFGNVSYSVETLIFSSKHSIIVPSGS